MKRIFSIIATICMCAALTGCVPTQAPAQVAATTLPVYEFTKTLCQGTDIRVTRLITESVSCLHEYTLKVSQMQAVEAADVIVISGANLEATLDFGLNSGHTLIDASADIELICYEEDHKHEHDHEHSSDPHIWLSPANARQMAHNIYEGLLLSYPQHAETLQSNLDLLDAKFDALSAYAQTALSGLSCRDLITFHDGFAYMADAFDLTVLHAIEEEAGSEASAAELIELVELIRANDIPAIFTERNGSTSAASVIRAETGTAVYTLDMAMAGDSYFDAMYCNIDTLKEALG